STDTTYTLLAKEAGTQLHHFYKTDNLTGNYIDDYLEVTVNETKGKSSTKITAPAYAEVIPPRPEQTRPEQTRSEQTQKIQESADGKTENAENLQNELETDANSSQYDENTAAQNKVQNTKTDTKISTTKDENQTKSDTNKTDAKQNNSNQQNKKTNVQQTKPSYSDDDIEFLEDVDEEEEYEEKSAPVENTEELLEQAKSLFNEKKYTEANTCLSVFFEYASTRRDEALYLQGQIYESESSVKDIKKAVETYKNLIQNYPASPYWDKANKRIIYLNRFYFEAR
nr:tetratricopeptide repeat protein [Treponema sp.]